MKRREFIALAGAAAAWPRAARAQQPERMRRIGVLMNATANDSEVQARLAAFLHGLQEAGWAVGRNLRIDIRWSESDFARVRRDAAELVALGPDVILAGVGGTTTPLQQATRTVPVVFAQGVDPVGSGVVTSLARPRGNATGFTQFEYSLSGKWLELLKELAPRMIRVAVLREAGAAGIGQCRARLRPALRRACHAGRAGLRLRFPGRFFGQHAREVNVATLDCATLPRWRGRGPSGSLIVSMKRRDFITLIGGAAVVWPLAARGQHGERTWRIGVLEGGGAADDPRSQANHTAFLQALRQLGWTDGRNVKIDYRWPAGDADKARKFAAELVALAPDVVLATSAPSLGSLLQATRTVPIVFVAVADPVGAGYVDSLSRPGGNATGFVLFDYSLSTKWLELLKEISPGVKRAAVLRDAAISSGIGQWGAISSAAASLGVEVSPVNVRDAPEIARGIAAFARFGNGGLIVTASPLSLIHREPIIALAARHKLPTVYFIRPFVAAGGLISYGPDQIDQFRRAAGYVDRILKGENPADLPVQAPTKYELVINLKTAKALGIDIPVTVLARADEVIE